MKRSPSKKGIERRKKPRSAPRSSTARSQVPTKKAPEQCCNCSQSLDSGERALFVEEEIGRIFCSEACIAAHFSPEIERLEKSFFKRLSPSDLTAEERESLAHLRWITLQEPDEVWREKTLTGDHRYTLISEFQPGARKVWSICICLFLRGEPSFLYLAFVTKNQAMVTHYRKGERIEWVRPPRKQGPLAGAETVEGDEDAGEDRIPTDRLASAWTADETFMAEMNQERGIDDIPPEEYSQYQQCLEPTLETPDEVWSVLAAAAESPEAVESVDLPDSEVSKEAAGAEGLKIYHFIRYYGEGDNPHWYLIIARETEDDEQIEIMDAFPTRDPSLVDRYRRGSQDVGHLDARPTTRVVH